MTMTNVEKPLQVVDDDPMGSTSLKRKRTGEEDEYGANNNTNGIDVTERAKRVQFYLPLDWPSLVKPIHHCHVSGKFSLGLPVDFCWLYLPRKNNTIILEDEKGQQYQTKYHYNLHKPRLSSSGWKEFCKAHKLVVGDVLVFQLLEPTKFKVYIVRLDGVDEVDNVNKSLGMLTI